MPARYAPTLSALSSSGYRHLLAYDHVLGADPAVHQGWSGPYDISTTFHEPLVLFGYLAAVTRLELVTGIIILPQRQTALVAKQAAEVDLLTGGRLRLGVGLGLEPRRVRGAGQDFTNRGRRAEEQVELLRRLWTEQSVTFTRHRRAGHRRGHRPAAGAAAHPGLVRRPVPAAYRRAGRLGDGWFPQVPPGPQLDAARAIVEQAAVGGGRDPDRARDGGPGQLAGAAGPAGRHGGRWREAGATHLSLNTMGAGLATVDAHLAALEQAAAALGLTPGP